MNLMGIQNQEAIMKKWGKLVSAGKDIKDESVRISTAIVLENAQNLVDYQAKTANGRSLLCEAASPAGIGTLNAMGPATPADSYANTTGDARVPSIVIPMIRRIYPQLIAHKLVGVQPMQGPIGMAFAFRAVMVRIPQAVLIAITLVMKSVTSAYTLIIPVNLRQLINLA